MSSCLSLGLAVGAFARQLRCEHAVHGPAAVAQLARGGARAGLLGRGGSAVLTQHAHAHLRPIGTLTI
eukprot:CAMPEP_0202871372 /NCGR_PEP_ID=MMETSP1391-20130828/18485_1 /ASSEMBLY_ACC=CAM_ASM_000867 /TAXON_ID=1034604 /ORGANISM="Chlamydomonas leiostraca, Strain SAG 11-49" /LENGTH=67 /DNA_ID=CAMNT_0049552147 /DNA_START=1741 /DNA_END=1944 /DNA_ORIENTATION=-